jgi:hypothetical protein
MSSHDEDAREQAKPPLKVAEDDAVKARKTIFLHVDGIKTSANWRIADYAGYGALSEENREKLAAKFDLPWAILQTFSIEIGNSLDVESLVNLTTVSRGAAIKRANKTLEESARLAKRIEQDLATLGGLLAPLSDNFVSEDEQKGVLASAQRQTEETQAAATGLHDAIDRVIRLPGSAADLSLQHKRKVSDGRRRFVVETCCYAWRDAGREVTYTTRPERVTERRGGPLIEFIQAVVTMVTDPPGKLSGETIRKDIDRWKLDNPDAVSIPPQEE